jgi:hypothetical protein
MPRGITVLNWVVERVLVHVEVILIPNPDHRKSDTADSTGRGNGFGEDSGWGFVAKGFSRA